MNNPRSPQFHLLVKDKNNPKSVTRAGAVWPDEYDGYRIKLNPGIVLDWRDATYLVLVPARNYNDRHRRKYNDDGVSAEGESTTSRGEELGKPESELDTPPPDDDIPF